MEATSPGASPMSQPANGTPSQTNLMMALATMKDLGRVGNTKEKIPKPRKAK
jgi:hypothetical protein